MAKDDDKKPVDKPKSAANTLKDNSVSAEEMAAKTGAKGAVAESTTATAARMQQETREESEKVDNSFAAKIARSGYMLHEDHVTGQSWVSTIDNELCKGAEHRCRHTPLNEVTPRTGLTIYPSEGEAYSIPMDWNRDMGPQGWAIVANPDTGDLLLK